MKNITAKTKIELNNIQKGNDLRNKLFNLSNITFKLFFSFIAAGQKTFMKILLKYEFIRKEAT